MLKHHNLIPFHQPSHSFYQHLPGSAQWGFNLVWGHSTSKDLVHWQLMEHAIEPTKGSVDNDGCFSGCAALDTDGTPCLLYSAVSVVVCAWSVLSTLNQ